VFQLSPSKPFFGRIGKSSFENQFKFNRPTFFFQEIPSTNLNSNDHKRISWDRQNTHEDCFLEEKVG